MKTYELDDRQAPRLSPVAINLAWFVLFCVGAFAAGCYLQFRVANVADTDPFYHYAHAHLYRVHGPLYSSFPWPTISIVSREPADIWYGFHLLLAPLASASSSVVSMKVAAAVITAASLAIIGAGLRVAGVPYAYAWPAVLLAASGDEMARFMMLRPQEISCGLALLVIAGVLKRRPAVAGAAAFAAIWIHLAMIPLIALALIAALFAGRIAGVGVERRTAIAATIGVVAGWLLRPHPLWAIHLFWVQIGNLAAVKMSGLDIDWGTELYPMKPGLFWSLYAAYLIVWVIATAMTAVAAVRGASRLAVEQRAFLIAAFGLAALFFAMVFLSASRSKDEWMVFSIASLAASVGWLLLPLTRASRPAVWAGLAVATGAFLAVSLPVNKKLIDDNFNPYRFEAVGNFLRTHSKPGQVVFTSYWMYFSELFFWDSENYYTGAADPIFEYALDKRKFWEWESLNHASYFDHVTDRPPARPGPPIDLHLALTRDFHASYILAFRQFQPYLLIHLAHDKRFQLVYYDGGVGIFKVL